MESISERCYPSNFFDPFGNEPTHERCSECREMFDIADLEYSSSGGVDFYYCPDCFEVLEILNEED